MSKYDWEREEEVIEDVVKDFEEWNGWGPPESEYQIHEYCKNRMDNLKAAEDAFRILREWMEK